MTTPRGTNRCGAIFIALAHLKQHKGGLLVAVFWRAIFVLVPMQVPILTGAIVDGLTARQISLYGFSWRVEDPVELLEMAVLGLLTVAIAYGGSSYGRMLAAAKLSQNFVASLRHRLVRHTAGLSLDRHQQFGAGELLDRTLSDTQEVRRFMDRVFIQSIANFLRLGYPVAMLVAIDPLLALVTLSVLAPQWFLSRHLHGKLQTATRGLRCSQSSLTTAVKEGLDGIETIKTLHAESATVDGIVTHIEKVETDELAANRYSALVSANVWSTTSIGVALTWWLGGLRVIAGEMSLGTLVVFTGFAVLMYRPFRQFTTIVSTYRRGLVSLERIQHLLTTESSLRVVPDAKPLAFDEGRIEFRGVTFAYGDRPVLTDVSCIIPPRQLTAIVGRSGSGKSSLLRLIARLYDPGAGDVLVDGQRLSAVTPDSVRSAVAIVPQQPMLFSGTLIDNIRLARPDASQADVETACRAADVWAFVERLKNGLNTCVGRGGVQLSGGEIQRVAIARALLCRPQILLLDEPTSAVDPQCESVIVSTLLKLRHEITVVLVAHRLATTRHADKILMMDEGRLVGEGTHQRLSTRSQLYNIVFSQQETTRAPAA